MKKIILIILITANISFFSGCSLIRNSAIDFTPYSYSDTEYTIIYETVGETATYTDESANESHTLQINGKLISGIYRYSEIISGSNCISHNYISENGDIFSIKNGSTKLVYFQSGDKLGDGLGTDRGVLLQIAKDFISSFADVSDYEINITNSMNLELSFNKKSGDLFTVDSAHIIINDDGSIYYFSGYMLGEIDTDDFKDFNLAEADEKILAKAAELFENSDYERTEYKIISRTQTLARGLEPAIRYDIDITYINETGSDTEQISERAELLFVKKEYIILACG